MTETEVKDQEKTYLHCRKSYLKEETLWRKIVPETEKRWKRPTRFCRLKVNSKVNSLTNLSAVFLFEKRTQGQAPVEPFFLWAFNMFIPRSQIGKKHIHSTWLSILDFHRKVSFVNLLVSLNSMSFRSFRLFHYFLFTCVNNESYAVQSESFCHSKVAFVISKRAEVEGRAKFPSGACSSAGRATIESWSDREPERELSGAKAGDQGKWHSWTHLRSGCCYTLVLWKKTSLWRRNKNGRKSSWKVTKHRDPSMYTAYGPRGRYWNPASPVRLTWSQLDRSNFACARSAVTSLVPLERQETQPSFGTSLKKIGRSAWVHELRQVFSAFWGKLFGLLGKTGRNDPWAWRLV